VSWKTLLALGAVLLSLGVWLVGQPTLADRVARIEPQLEKKIASGAVQIDPAELLDMYINDNIAVWIFDLRDEVDFNLFHIVDSRRVTLAKMGESSFVKSLPADTVIVLASNGERRATQAWKLLVAQKVPNIYILDGGINHWVDIYAHEHMSKAPEGCQEDECRRYVFDSALGGRHPASDPNPHEIAKRSYTKKVKGIGHKARKSGGCG
jgi:rhodanese-related sulfurtransferase